VASEDSYKDLSKSRRLTVESQTDTFEIENLNVIPPTKTSEIGPVDYILLTTKTYHIPQIIPSLFPLLGPNTLIVPLQNGIEATSVLCQALGPSLSHHVGCGSCILNSSKLGIGHIKIITPDGLLHFGETDNRQSERVLKLARFFNSCRAIVASVPEDIHTILWKKFILIVGSSGVGSITRVSIGQWFAIPETRQVFKECLKEGTRVANAHGQCLSDEKIVEENMERYEGILKDKPNSTTSMQRDLIEGKQSEMEELIGGMVRLAAQKNVPIPTISVIYAALKPQDVFRSKL